MYKAKVWIHKEVNDILENKSPFWVDITFVDPPQNGEFFNISKDLVTDIERYPLWEKQFGPGRYKAINSEKMFDPSIHDGFSYCIMAIKVQ